MEEPTIVRYWDALQKHSESREEGGDEIKLIKTQRKLGLVAARDSAAMRQLASEYEGEGRDLTRQMGRILYKMQSASDKGQAWRRYSEALQQGFEGGSEGVTLGRNTMRAIYRSSNSDAEVRAKVAQYKATKMAGRGADPAVFDPVLAREKYDAARLSLRHQEGDRDENTRKREKNQAKMLAVVEQDAEKAQEVAQGFFRRIDHHNTQYMAKLHQLQRVRGKIQGWTAKADEIDGLREQPYRYALPPSPPATPSSDSREEAEHSDADSEW